MLSTKYAGSNPAVKYEQGVQYFWSIEGLSRAQAHIGAVLVAGVYCYDCKILLCDKGVDSIGEATSYWSKCPRCKLTVPPRRVLMERWEDRATRAAKGEKVDAPTGVDIACAFVFRQRQPEVGVFLALLMNGGYDKPIVHTDDGIKLTAAELTSMIAYECEIYIDAQGVDW